MYKLVFLAICLSSLHEGVGRNAVKHLFARSIYISHSQRFFGTCASVRAVFLCFCKYVCICMNVFPYIYLFILHEGVSRNAEERLFARCICESECNAHVYVYMYFVHVYV